MSTRHSPDAAGPGHHSHGAVVAGAPKPWLRTRIARPVRELARSAAFYREIVGLPMSGGFAHHDGYDGVFLTLPGGVELELTAGPDVPRPVADDDLLVLYVANLEQVDVIASQLADAGAASAIPANPCWRRWARAFLDPDGYRALVAAEDTPE